MPRWRLGQFVHATNWLPPGAAAGVRGDTGRAPASTTVATRDAMECARVANGMGGVFVKGFRVGEGGNGRVVTLLLSPSSWSPSIRSQSVRGNDGQRAGPVQIRRAGPVKPENRATGPAPKRVLPAQVR